MFQHAQTRGRDTHGFLSLSGLKHIASVRSEHMLSPFYQLKHCPDTEGRLEMIATWQSPTGRNNHLFLSYMKAFILRKEPSDDGFMTVNYAVLDAGDAVAFGSFDIDFTDSVSQKSISDELVAAVISDASTHHSMILTAADIYGDGVISFQAAIADAPADAVTNYNIVTTLLGTLTSAVNTANAKQNDIATTLNSLLAELRTLGLIAT